MTEIIHTFAKELVVNSKRQKLPGSQIVSDSEDDPEHRPSSTNSTVSIASTNSTESPESEIISDSEENSEYKPSPNSSSDAFNIEDEIPVQPVIKVKAGTSRAIQENILVMPAKYDRELVKRTSIGKIVAGNTGSNTKSKKTRQICYFCESPVLNFARHIFRNHSEEIETQRILSAPPNSKQRKDLLTTLRKKGNYLGNIGDGKPIRKNYGTSYIPCIHCLGFYSSKNLWRHRKTCSENPDCSSSTAGTPAESQNFMIRNMKIDSQLREKVFPRMRADMISLVAKKDPLICAYGARYMKTHKEKHFVNVTSRKMRELSKLLIELRKLKPSIKNFFDSLKPQNFDLLVAATKIVSRYDEDNEIYGAPTFAMNMGTSLKQCCDIALLHVMQKKFTSISSAEAESDIKTTIQLIEGHWKFQVSSQAGSDLNVKKWNKISIVPLASDMKLLKDHLITEANRSIASLEKNNEDQAAFTKLTETIFCRVILLNRKRPGELQRFPLHTYETFINNDENQGYEEFSEVVSDAEKLLMKGLKRIVIRGKRGRGVPVLFSKDVQEHLAILHKYRSNIIKKPNTFLFGNPKSDQPIVGYKVIQKYAYSCGAKNPSAITCTRLRKHLATLTQLFNMSENDMEQLASFMGHTLGVHRSSYRLPDDVYQTAKISKLLILMEKGQAGQYKGKGLDEIDLNLDEDLMEMANEEEIEEYNTGNGEVLEADTDDLATKEIVPKISKGRRRVLVPWTEEQKKIVTSYFNHHIKSKRPPKRCECQQLKALHPVLLKNKDWLKIKVYIQNKYTKKL